jgi:hypothetical protein
MAVRDMSFRSSCEVFQRVLCVDSGVGTPGMTSLVLQAFKESATLYYPDYDLDWILRADASKLGVGMVLFQVFINAAGEKINQPILFGSQKFTEPAQR